MYRRFTRRHRTPTGITAPSNRESPVITSYSWPNLLTSAPLLTSCQRTQTTDSQPALCIIRSTAVTAFRFTVSPLDIHKLLAGDRKFSNSGRLVCLCFTISTKTKKINTSNADDVMSHFSDDCCRVFKTGY